VYSFWERSLIKDNKFPTVPTVIRDDVKASAYNYSSVGIRNFLPWFLADANPAQNDDYFRVILDILAEVDAAVEKEEYWFFRGDINVLMMVFFCVLNASYYLD
jgi:hypothetical protein